MFSSFRFNGHTVEFQPLILGPWRQKRVCITLHFQLPKNVEKCFPTHRESVFVSFPPVHTGSNSLLSLLFIIFHAKQSKMSSTFSEKLHFIHPSTHYRLKTMRFQKIHFRSVLGKKGSKPTSERLTLIQRFEYNIFKTLNQLQLKAIGWVMRRHISIPSSYFT